MASPTSFSTLSTALPSTSGPTSVPSCAPSPTFSPDMRSLSFRENSSMTSRCTRIRLAAVHASPMLRIFAAIAASTATSRFASSHTMNGAFPPSSIEVRNTPRAHCSSSSFPTGVEPVNDSLRALPESIHGSTTEPGDVVHTIESTPSGRPASRSRSTMYSEVRGVRLAGL